MLMLDFIIVFYFDSATVKIYSSANSYFKTKESRSIFFFCVEDLWFCGHQFPSPTSLIYRNLGPKLQS